MVVLVSGCAGRYVIPEGSNTIATFKMSESLKSTSNQFYYVFSEEGCDEKVGDGMVSNMNTMWGANEEDIPLRPSDRVYVYAKNIVNTSSRKLICSNFVSFIPEENTKYLVQQKGAYPGCQLPILDLESAKAAESLQVHKIPRSCRKL